MNRKRWQRIVEALASHMGWKVDTSGKTWRVTSPTFFAGLSYAPVALFALLVRVATSPWHVDGRGMDRESLETILAPVGGPPTSVPASTTATDEATLARVWPDLI
jgi:hypothetical protein